MKLLLVIVLVGLAAALPNPFPKVVEVNFGAAGGLDCGTLYEDVGRGFGSRPDGLQWGWVKAGTNMPITSSGGREREDVGQGCVERGTMHMQYNDCCPASTTGYQGHMEWMFSLPNGRYEITVIMGDKARNSVHYLREKITNTVILTPKDPSYSWKYYQGTAQVQVSAGKIRLSAERNGVNAKLNYVKIKKVLAAETGCVPIPSQFDGASISPYGCSRLKPELPFANKFDGALFGFKDLSGKSNGFRSAIPSSRFSNKVKRGEFSMGNGFMDMKAIRGTWMGNRNEGRNAFGVGLNLPAQDIQMQTKVRIPVTVGVGGTQDERFCLYMAVSDMEFAWLCVVKQSGGYKAHVYYEFGDEMLFNAYKNIVIDGNRVVHLRMKIFVETNEVRALIKLPGSSRYEIVRSFNVNPLTLNKDQAGTDSRVGTRTFGGVIASKSLNRYANAVYRVFKFNMYALEQEADFGSGIEKVDFRTFTVGNDANSLDLQVKNPTSMVWAGNKLWVAQVDGRVTSLGFNSARNKVVSRQNLRPLGVILLLGLDKDPRYGRNGNDCLWFSYSSADRNEGQANSGKIAKVCGPTLGNVTVVIRGLPRAISNHAINNINFGPDNNLYINVGGNSAAGSPNTVSSSAFKTRPEQPLSAALLKAPVFKSGFRGDCTPSQPGANMDLTGVASKEMPNCDVTLYATGLRNSFDCTFHPGRGNKIYCPDNGIGGGGSFPPQNGARNECDGIVSDPVQIEALDPGIRNDLLHLVEPGSYLGHPNPSRGECVPFAGNPTGGRDKLVPQLPIADGLRASMEEPKLRVGVRPLTNYREPVISFGLNHSPNGITTYTSDKMCGQLKNQLLVNYFSVSPQVRRLRLSGDGKRVIDDGTLRRSSSATGGAELEKPLGIALDGLGNIYVGQFGANKITVFVPKAAICSRRRTVAADGPVRLQGAGSASSGRELFVFGGISDHSRHMERNHLHAYKYHAGDDRWQHLPQLPEPIAGAATLHLHGAVYIVGGTNEMGEASSHVWRYDVLAETYERLADLPTARSGAVAVDMNGEMLILGGQTAAGVTEEVLVLRNGSWEHLPEMHEARSFAGAGVVSPDLPFMEDDGIAKSAVKLGNDRVIMCGGSNGSAEPLQSCEQFDGSKWSSMPPMASARSHFAAFSVHGHMFVVKGGKYSGETVGDDIEYYNVQDGEWTDGGKMRVGRSHAVHGVLNGDMYLFSGISTWDDTAQGEVSRVG